MCDDFLGKNQAFQATPVSKLKGEKVYRFEGEAAANRFFNRLACIERCGVPKPDIHLLMSRWGYPVIALSGEILARESSQVTSDRAFHHVTIP